MANRKGKERKNYCVTLARNTDCKHGRMSKESKTTQR